MFVIISHLSSTFFISRFGATNKSIQVDRLIKFNTNSINDFKVRRHEYFRQLNIVIVVDICIFTFYAINLDVVNLLTNSSFSLLATLN